MKIAIGSAQFGSLYGISNTIGKTCPDEVLKIITLSNEVGIDLIDTAINYGDSELVLGNVGINNFKIVTKLPSLPLCVSDVNDWVRNHIKSSCFRLKTSSLYAVLVHKSSDLAGEKGLCLIRALNKTKDAGFMKKIGISIYDPHELDSLASIMNFDLVQAPLNVIDRRLVDSGWLFKLKDSGIEVHTRSTFLQGLLLMNRTDIPAKFNRWEGKWRQWEFFLRENKTTALMQCLAYPQSIKEVDKVIVGINSRQHLEEILFTQRKLNTLINTSFMKSTDVELINPSYWRNM